MSIKVHNGFLMKDCSLGKLKTIIEVYKQEVKEIAAKRFATFVENVVKEDASTLSVKEKESKAFSLWMMRREEIDINGSNDPFVDISCELLFIPVEVEGVGYLAGVIFTKNKEMIDCWINKEDVLSFSYNDQADQPENITDKEWDFRKKVWSVLTNEIITMQGFSFEVLSKKMVFPF